MITIGSPVAPAASGPSTDETKTIPMPSGAVAVVLPDPGSGALVPVSSASPLAPDPSGFAMTRPDLSPTRPRYAIHWLSGDHSGFPAGSLSAPKRTLFPSAIVITHN